MYIAYILVFLAGATVSLFGMDRSCWFGNFLEVNPYLTYERRSSDEIYQNRNRVHRHLTSTAYIAGASLSPDPFWSCDAEAKLAKQQDAGYSMRALDLQIRKLFMDDLVSDPVSFSCGAGITLASNKQLRDLLQMQPSKMAASIHATVGKEFLSSDKGFFHVYATALAAIGKQASPWLQGDIAANYVIGSEDRDNHTFGIHFISAKGLGSARLRLDSHRPYAHSNWSYTTLGVQYRCALYGYGSLALELSKRLHARSCPRNVKTIALTLTIPFAL